MVDSGTAHAGQQIATQFLEQARSPGLDIEGSPFEIAQDYAYALRHLAEWLSKGHLEMTGPTARPTIHLSDSLDWKVSAFQDRSGTLHRWTSAARIDDDWLSRELHSWAVLGDTMAASMPMMLHVVETGSVRHGHLYGPWSRIYRHPLVIGRYQFQKVDGSPVEGDWKIQWAQDLKFSPAEWVDLMLKDRVEGIRHLPIAVPDEHQRQQWILQLEDFIPRLLARRDPLTVLGNPSICDSPLGVCQFQVCCYPPTDPEKAGGFVRVGN